MTKEQQNVNSNKLNTQYSEYEHFSNIRVDAANAAAATTSSISVSFV